MYPNLFFVEGWIKELTKEVKGLIYERPYSVEVDISGERHIYGEFTLFSDQLFLNEYTPKALSVLSKLDAYRDDSLLNSLRNELRDGQFDNHKTKSLNKYAAKVLLSFNDLWMSGSDFDSFYSYTLPGYVKDCELHDDGIKYYYKDEELELGNILYRIRSFFKYSGYGHKADRTEYTLESILKEYAEDSSVELETPTNKVEPVEPMPLLTTLGNCLSICSDRLMGILTVCDQIMKSRSEGRASDFYFGQSIFIELESTLDKIANITWNAMQGYTLQNEIRKTLISFQRERQDEVYFLLIKDVITRLKKYQNEATKYLENKEAYDNFIDICHWNMTDEDSKISLHALSKIHPGIYSQNLLSNTNYLEIIIKSIIPLPDHYKILPDDELKNFPVNNSPESLQHTKKETPTKDQVLLLSELGLFDLPQIKKLTTENKGKLFARLLNRNEKNVTECIRNCDPKGNKQAENNPYIYEKKVDSINDFLTAIGYFK